MIIGRGVTIAAILDARGSTNLRALNPKDGMPLGKNRGLVIVGFAGVDAPYLAWLYVDPAHYRRGIGRSLLRVCLDRVNDDAWTLACGNNTPALSLYESEGFVVQERFVGKNAGYRGASARLALEPHRRGWTKPKRSEL